MGRAVDLFGRHFGKLVVLGKSHVDARRVSHWHCLCACGNKAIVGGNNLTSGNSKSCGCRHGLAFAERLTRQQLKDFLSYNPRTGLFHWKRTVRSCKKGAEAGHSNDANQYSRISLNGIQYYAHVLAWFYMVGKWPEHEVDHRDTNKSNNRWKNLREATHPQNNWNRPKTRVNKSGFKGVKIVQHGFTARITHNKRTVLLGSFSSAILAAKAYDRAARKYHGRFARTNFGDSSRGRVVAPQA